MTYLIIALLIPWVAPLIWVAITSFRELTSSYTRFFYVLVIAILAIGFIPDHYSHDGWKAFVFMGIGWGIFAALDYLSKRVRSSRRLSLYLLGATIFLHGFGDGAGIFLSTLNNGPNPSIALAVSILLHRLPASFGVWAFLIPRFSRVVPILILAILTVGTLLGYGVLGLNGDITIHEHYIHIIEYLVAGGLIHLGVLAKRNRKTKHHQQKNSCAV